MESTKICNKCSTEKPISEFPILKKSPDGKASLCSICSREYNRQYREQNKIRLKEKRKIWEEKNAEDLRVKKQTYRQTHKEQISLTKKLWYKRNSDKVRARVKERYYKNSAIIKEQCKTYYHRNYTKIAKQKLSYSVNKLKTDKAFKLLCNLRNRIKMALRLKNGKKAFSTIELIGCSISDLKQHLESKFQTGMTWDNHGTYGWHIDHIIPCSSFDLTDPEQQKKCFHYTNLQPLWAKDNLYKSDKLV